MTEPIKAFFPRVIDSSMLGAWRSCRQKFFREYIQHWKPRGESVHLIAGGAYAAGLEEARRAFYERGLPTEEAEFLGAEKLREVYGSFIAPPGSPKTVDGMVGALDFYFANYPMAHDSARPATMPGGRLGIEFSFAEPLPVLHPESGEPIIFAGRADMVVDLAKSLYIEDDKTTGQMGSTWDRQWEMRGQFTGYCWAARQIGLDVAGVLIRGVAIRKTGYDTMQPLTYRAEFEVDRWIRQTVRDIEEMKRCWAEGYWDWNLDEACTAYSGCQFLNPCKSAQPDDWLTQQFEQRVWDPQMRHELPIDEYLLQWKEA